MATLTELYTDDTFMTNIEYALLIQPQLNKQACQICKLQYYYNHIEPTCWETYKAMIGCTSHIFFIPMPFNIRGAVIFLPTCSCKLEIENGAWAGLTRTNQICALPIMKPRISSSSHYDVKHLKPSNCTSHHQLPYPPSSHNF